MTGLLSLLIYTFATLTYHCCEGRKEAEHAGDARWISDWFDLTISLRSGELEVDAPRIILNMWASGVLK